MPRPYLIAFGANLPSVAGTPRETLRVALTRLAQHQDVRLIALSRFWQSPAFPAGSGPDFVNGCAALDSSLDPEAVLAILHRIEAGLGRRREGGRWQARPVDLDLLACGDLVCPDPARQTAWRELAPADQATRAPDRLILPHPRLQDRAFVLAPLAEIAPGWRHPLLGQSVTEVLSALPRDLRAQCRVLLDTGSAGAQ